MDNTTQNTISQKNLARSRNTRNGFAGFLFSALLLITGVIPNTAADNTVNTFDDFEDDVLTQNIVGDFYTVGTNICGGASSSTVVAAADPDPAHSDQSGIFSPGSDAGNGSGPCIRLNDDPCSKTGATVSFDIYMTGYTSVGTTRFGFSGSEAFMGVAVGISVSTTGAVVSVPSSTALGTMALNTWHTVEISGIQCNASPTLSRRATICFDDGTPQCATPTIAIPASLKNIAAIRSQTGSSPTAYIDNVNYGGYFTTHALTSSAALTNVQGFDMAPSATHIITRGGTSPGPINVLDGESLTALGSAINSDCVMSGGVVALADGVAYFACSANNIVSLNFRSTALGNYATLATDDIVLTGLGANIERTFIAIRPCAENWATTSTGGVNYKSMCFLITSSNGGLYALGIQQRTNDDPLVVGDQTGLTSLTLSSVVYAASVADDICSQFGAFGQFFVIDSATTTKGFVVNHIESGFGTQSTTITNNFNGAAAINSANDLDCATTEGTTAANCGSIGAGGPCDKDRIAIRKSTAMHSINTITGATLFNRAATGVSVVGVSGDGKWFGTIANDGLNNANNGFMKNATTGTNVGRFAVPTGTIAQMRVDRYAQSVYIQTTAAVHRATIYEATSIVPIADIPTPATTSTGPSAAPTLSGPAQNTLNPLGQAVNYFNVSWGFDGSSLFGIAVVGFVALGFSRISKSPLILALGAFLGLVVAFMLGLFSVWVLFVVIFLIIAVAGRTLFRGADEEGGE